MGIDLVGVDFVRVDLVGGHHSDHVNKLVQIMQVLNSQLSIHHTRLHFEVLSRWVEGKIFGVGGNASLVLRV